MRPLLINVEEIKESAQGWEAELPREFLDEVLRGDPPTEYHANGASHLRVALTKMGRKVLVTGTFLVPLRGQCKRCLKPVELAAPGEITRTFSPAPEERGEHKRGREPRAARATDDDADFAPAEELLADEDVYSGKSIDLTPAMREQVLLSLPPSPVCKEDCKGLCPHCGKDLNEGPCGCEQPNIDPRWEALKALQLKTKE